jgi:DNA-binding HxlR family transcriptional regulator
MDMWPEFRSQCPVASALDIVGDNGDLAEMPEAISSNILADRLERLEARGLITKGPYQQNPVRYEYRLTKRGADLLPVLQELAAWAAHHIPGRWSAPRWFREGRPEDFYPAKS